MGDRASRFTASGYARPAFAVALAGCLLTPSALCQAAAEIPYYRGTPSGGAPSAIEARRLAVWHNSLDGSLHAGQLLSDFHGACPRAAESRITEPCTVIEWRDWGRVGRSDTLGFEAILYHTTGQIVLQYAATGTAGTPTVGLQDRHARTGGTFACGGANVPADGSAICLFDPRYPSGSHGLVDPLFRDGFDG